MKLATAEFIHNLTPIEGADLIETAHILGWQVVVKKGDFKIGDLVSYIQIDTQVPETEQFEFLRARNFRVRTIKVKGQISQGLIVPLPKGKYQEGQDLSSILGVTKYEKPQPKEVVKVPSVWYRKYWWLFKQRILWKYLPILKPKPKGKSFPTHLVSKTDEERIQNITRVLDSHKGKTFIISEKLDGSSITIIHDLKKVVVCSRNLICSGKDNKFIKVYQDTKFIENLKLLVAKYGTNNIIVQGEFIGEPQGNKYNLNSNEIRLFNIYVNNKRLNQKDFYNVCNEFNIPCCPYLEEVILNHSLEDLLKMAEGKSKLYNTEREGIVMRCIEDNLSFKVISNKFLLKNEE